MDFNNKNGDKMQEDKLFDKWIKDFKHDYEQTVEAIDWYIQTITSYGGGNLDLIYEAMIKVMVAIKNNENLDGYVGFREDLIKELEEEYGDDIIDEWIDELDDEEDLMCLDWHEYHDKEPYFVDKSEIEQMFNNAININEEIKANKLTENRYEVTFNADILYFVCPLNAREQVKKDWKELKWLFKEYE